MLGVKERKKPRTESADTLPMRASVLAAFWYGSLLCALGLAEPWPPELDEIAERYFRVERAWVRA